MWMVDWNYVRTQLQRYPESGNDCLYRIGTHINVLIPKALEKMQGGQLTPEMRSRVLNWLRKNANQIGLTVEI